jgi:hypothetical protein
MPSFPVRRLVLSVMVATLAWPLASAAEPTLEQRRAAATETAQHNAACQAIRPFYWSIGDAGGTRGDGRVGLLAPGPDTRMPIASASKMVYGAYVTELRDGHLSDEDVAFLHFTSGYTQFDHCLRAQTVAECQSYQGGRIHNGGHVPANDGKFFYSGGHMQKHASLVGLGDDGDDALAAAVDTLLHGTGFSYAQPQLAGGIVASANQYGAFLREVVGGQLPAFKAALGTHKVCTNPSTCPTAVYTPMPEDESPHYSIGHWVEDDAPVEDGAFSSAGAFGFYPWIDASKTWWGVIARESLQGIGDADKHHGPGVRSVYCGREIRGAWMSGKAR